MLEIILSEQEQTKNKLVVDGVTVTENLAHISSKGNENIWVRIYDYDLSQKITGIRFNEIPKEIGQ